MARIDEQILIAGGILLVAVASAVATRRARFPLLITFLGLGMLLGSEGVGGIYFADAELARSVGIVGLIAILFEGGLTTDWPDVRPVIGPAFLLSTVGVFVTTAVTGLAAHLLFDLSWTESFLLGAVVGSTDAAAVFATLRFTMLRRRLASVLAAESGLNDPTAVALDARLRRLDRAPRLRPRRPGASAGAPAGPRPRDRARPGLRRVARPAADAERARAVRARRLGRGRGARLRRGGKRPRQRLSLRLRGRSLGRPRRDAASPDDRLVPRGARLPRPGRPLHRPRPPRLPEPPRASSHGRLSRSRPCSCSSRGRSPSSSRSRRSAIEPESRSSSRGPGSEAPSRSCSRRSLSRRDVTGSDTIFNAVFFVTSCRLSPRA